MSRAKCRKLPCSGDRLVDTLFRIIVDVLDKEIEAIHMKRVLRDPDDHRKELHGLITQGKIYLGKNKHLRTHQSLASTLIHELLHAAIETAFERRVKALEEILFVRFTDAQKRFLRKYLPKHEVKTEPK